MSVGEINSEHRIWQSLSYGAFYFDGAIIL